jgi:hypothetical protein
LIVQRLVKKIIYFGYRNWFRLKNSNSSSISFVGLFFQHLDADRSRFFCSKLDSVEIFGKMSKIETAFPLFSPEVQQECIGWTELREIEKGERFEH